MSRTCHTIDRDPPPPVGRKPLLIKGGPTPVRLDKGGFIALPNMPGWVDTKSKDHGLGPLAMIVRSILSPGRLIAMHEHQNDEIVSWVPDGIMRHDDRANGKLVIDGGHMMVMNAGRSFWHSEETLKTDPPLDMLQIFVRPREVDLEPAIQHGPIAPAVPNVWRHLFGPEGSDAPFFVRNEVDFFDIGLEAGACLEFPAKAGRALYFYVFRGEIAVGSQSFTEADQGLDRNGGKLRLAAVVPSSVVAFLVKLDATVTRKGTVGDNRRLPPAILFRALQFWNRLRQGRSSQRKP